MLNRMNTRQNDTVQTDPEEDSNLENDTQLKDTYENGNQ
jgi:hypothetical protein